MMSIIPDPVVKPPEKKEDLSSASVWRALVGNSAICVLKFGVWMKTGSSAMLSEAVHSLVDVGNQALLVQGLAASRNSADKQHQYGYGRAAYFWALVSALGMFWMGAGFSVFHGVSSLLHPGHAVESGWETWAVLAASFGVDGWVLTRTWQELSVRKPADMPTLTYLKNIRDPFIAAVLLEDAAACAGVLVAGTGLLGVALTGWHTLDALASIGVGVILGGVAISLIRLNQRYLLGQAIDSDTQASIKQIILQRKSIEAVRDVQSQWTGPNGFSFKAEIDFDGTELAARLHKEYEPAFLASADLKEDLPVLLSYFAEDVTRLVETEIKELEKEIRAAYPQAKFIELEPDSPASRQVALDDMDEAATHQAETVAMREALLRVRRLR